VILIAGKGHEPYQEINGVSTISMTGKIKKSIFTKINSIRMLYYLFQYLDKLNFPERGFLIHFIQVCAAVITSLIISLLIGKRIINLLQKNSWRVVRDLGLEGQYQKKELRRWEE